MTSQHGSTRRARVLAAITKQDEGELTTDDILAALQEEDITDLEKLATRLHKTIRDRGDSNPRSMATFDWQALSKPASSPAGWKIVHRAPAIPFIVDGVQHEPQDIHQLDGQPLHFVLTRTDAPDPVLVAFTDFGPISAYLQARWVEPQLGMMNYRVRYCWGADRDPVTGAIRYYQYPCGYEMDQPSQQRPPPPPPPPAPPSLIAVFHEHFHSSSGRGSGNSISLQPQFLYSDLTKVHMSGIFPFDEDWNDQISGVTLNGATVLCAEHTNFEGSRILLSPSSGSGTIDLTPLGWSDRISSMWNYGALL